MALTVRLLSLRNSPILFKLPPYLSALCILVGVAWLLLLPLNEYSRQTYVSENAILPGQVHTYFGGSEHNVFRAYRQEVFSLGERSPEERHEGLGNILKESGLKVADQTYRYRVAGEDITGTNVYGILQGPRADATEAMVLMAAWRNFDGIPNYSGLALALTLVRYFSRWSIWSKDIILLIPEESTYGSMAWVEAYHSTSPTPSASRNISALPIKSGALQAAVALDYPVGPWGHRFDKLDIQYDGLNGALPNLDLLNTAVSIASGQMGIGCTLHGISTHRDSYTDRLRTLVAGVGTQSLGHATGPHSAFMPYHIDAITLKTTGNGWHDEMSLGRATESVFRSINNLLEHLHQSFFFYILLNANRFVSIGNYLPAAMLVAGSFTIAALALWAESGRAPVQALASLAPATTGKGEKQRQPKMEVVRSGDDVALVPVAATQAVDRNIALPATVLLGIHLASTIPLYLMTHVSKSYLPTALHILTLTTLILPPLIAQLLKFNFDLTPRHCQTLQSLSLLLLGATLHMLATLNFSLALVVGLLASPLAFVRTSKSLVVSAVALLVLAILSPPVVFYAMGYAREFGLGGAILGEVLMELAKGWVAQGSFTEVAIWGVWWPAWVVGGVVVWSGILPDGEERKRKV